MYQLHLLSFISSSLVNHSQIHGNFNTFPFSSTWAVHCILSRLCYFPYFSLHLHLKICSSIKITIIVIKNKLKCFRMCSINLSSYFINTTFLFSLIFNAYLPCITCLFNQFSTLSEASDFLFPDHPYSIIQITAI